MKRQKKIFALLAAILMMASLLSIGVGAEGTAEREELPRTTYTYVTAMNTYIYENKGGTGSTTSVSKRARVSSNRSKNTWASCVASSSSGIDHWPGAWRGSAVGYMWDRKICPKTNCYKVFFASAYLFSLPDASSTKLYSSKQFSVGTIMYHIDLDNGFRYVYMLSGGQVYAGWIDVSLTEKEDGTA